MIIWRSNTVAIW